MTVSLPFVVLALAFALALALVAYRAGRGSSRRGAGGPVHVTAAEVLETDEHLRRLGGLDVAEKREERRMQMALARSAAAPPRKPEGVA